MFTLASLFGYTVIYQRHLFIYLWKAIQGESSRIGSWTSLYESPAIGIKYTMHDFPCNVCYWLFQHNYNIQEILCLLLKREKLFSFKALSKTLNLQRPAATWIFNLCIWICLLSVHKKKRVIVWISVLYWSNWHHAPFESLLSRFNANPDPAKIQNRFLY